MPHLARYLNSTAYILVLCCLVSVSFAFSLETHHPYDPIKQVFFHLFALLACFFIVSYSLLTSTFPIEKNFLDILVFAYLGYNTLSFFLTSYADRNYFINLALLILLFFIAGACINSERRYTYLLYVLGGIATVSALYAFLQFFGRDYEPLVGGFSIRFGSLRVMSFFGNPNFFAAFLVVCLPLFLSGFFAKHGMARYFFAGCTLLAGGALFLTGTRSAMLAAGISCVLFCVIAYGKPGKTRYLGAVAVTAGLVISGFLYSARVEGMGFEPRQAGWWTTLEIVEDHPVFGTGVGSFNVYHPGYRDRFEEIALAKTTHETRLEHVHNEFLEILSDLGLSGLLLFLGILFVFFYRYYLSWNPERKYLVAGNCCAVAGVLIHSLYSVNQRYFFLAMFFWLILAMQSVLLGKSEVQESTTQSPWKLLASLLLLPLFAMVVLSHSVTLYSAERHLKEGFTLYFAENFRGAEPHFKKAIESDPQHKSALYFLGMTQYRLEKFAESKQTLHRLVRLDPNYLQGHYWLASSYFATGDLEKAKEEYLESLRVNAAYSPSYLALGLVAAEDNDLQESLSYFERAYLVDRDGLKAGDTKVHALQDLIVIHRRLGNDQEAGAYDTILAEHHLETGLKFYKADNLRAAEPHLKEAIESDPQHESALYFFGRVQYGLGSFVESKQTLLKLIELDPNHLDGWHWLANSYVATGDFEKAKEGYGEALRINSRYAASYVALGLGFYPDLADTSKKADNGQGGVSWENDDSTAPSSNEKRWRWPTIQA